MSAAADAGRAGVVRSGRRSLPLLTAAGLCDEIGFRIGQLVWPFLALDAGTGAWGVGLAAGSFGIPVMLSPWWSRRIRQRVVSSDRIALLSLAEAVVLLVVPVLVVLGRVGILTLVAVGLVRGTLTALTVPGRTALMADVGDARPGTSAVRALSWDEGQTRAAYIIGPALGGLLWAWGPFPATVASSATCAAAALLAWAARARQPAGRPDRDVAEDQPRIRDALRGNPTLQATWSMRGATAVAWFGLGLGLPLLSERSGYGATLAATALTLYGVGGLAVAVLVNRRVDRLPPMPTQHVAWFVMGAAVVVIGLVPRPAVVVAAAVVAGAGTQLANVCGNAELARVLTGPRRRAALSGLRTLTTVLSTAGLMAAGPLFALAGVGPTVVASGVLIASTAVATLVVGPTRRRRRAPPG